MSRTFDAIVATDIVVSPAPDDDDGLAWLKSVRQRIDMLAERGRGRIVAADGLSLIYAFPDTASSVTFALQMHGAVTAKTTPPEWSVQIRTGIARACAQEGEGLVTARALKTMLTDGIGVSAGVHVAAAALCPMPFRDFGSHTDGTSLRFHAYVAPWLGSRRLDLARVGETRKRVATWLIGGHAATLITSSVAAIWLCATPALDMDRERLAAQARSMRATASVNTRAPSTMSSSAVSSVQ
jgi:hypothetical protein